MTAPVYIEQFGQGSPVLFLHGMPTPWDLLRPLADAAVANGHRALIAALPGYGPNASAPTFDSVEAVAAGIEAAVAALGVTSLAVVGYSSGAYHALNLAVRARLDVRTLMLLGGYADLSAEERDGLRGFARALAAGVSLAGVPTTRFLTPAFAASHPDACARVEAWLVATSRENLVRELDALALAPSLLADVSALPCTLVARTGQLDLATPPHHAELLARTAPRGKAEIVPACGHALLEEDRDGTISATLAALA